MSFAINKHEFVQIYRKRVHVHMEVSRAAAPALAGGEAGDVVVQADEDVEDTDAGEGDDTPALLGNGMFITQDGIYP